MKNTRSYKELIRKNSWNSQWDMKRGDEELSREKIIKRQNTEELMNGT